MLLKKNETDKGRREELTQNMHGWLTIQNNSAEQRALARR
jgi:hypothetical protein